MGTVDHTLIKPSIKTFWGCDRRTNTTDIVWQSYHAVSTEPVRMFTNQKNRLAQNIKPYETSQIYSFEYSFLLKHVLLEANDFVAWISTKLG